MSIASTAHNSLIAHHDKLIDFQSDMSESMASKRDTASYANKTFNLLDNGSLRGWLYSGIGSKIVDLKVNYALSDAIYFEDKEKEKYFNSYILPKVKQAMIWALAFRRGILTIQEINKDPSESLSNNLNINNVVCNVFDGTIVAVEGVNYTDTIDSFYRKPKYYLVNGTRFHHSRVIDFRYKKLDFQTEPQYQFSGVSIFDLIHQELAGDYLSNRAGRNLLERSSIHFAGIEGFNQKVAMNQHKPIVDAMGLMSQGMSMYGIGVVDKETTLSTLNTTIPNLADIDIMTLRRIALVADIPLQKLMGENATSQGLGNSQGGTDKTFLESVKTFQSDYLEEPLIRIFNIFRLGDFYWKVDQNITALEKAERESLIIDNALKLQSLGLDATKYLDDKDINVSSSDNDLLNEFSEPEDDEVVDVE
ncbi:anti-CBASS protein Acb1 family protein [Francisella marina]|uniref:DUF1073 domain-containing protein n=1 Tax=Francisella marina TaxID=2249302 RepID=A0ABX5ZHD0_9GAMM|nr:anti-CBASS Acb1 family protein [Francisella marina]QEO57572.1 DUF1073 domain-containing protein [Francisella marina]